jgi:peptidoglycan/LPS O-acetylase OafA/YrhL
VVISGFCIHRTSALAAARTGCQQLNWAGFWKRRFWRLYPTYIAAIILTLVLSQWVYNAPVISGEMFGWDLLTHLLLIHNLTDEFNTGLGNGVFWSLGMEEQLYGLYFFLFLMFRNGRYRFALWVVTSLAVVWRLAVPWMMEVKVNMGPFHLGSWYHWPFFYCLHWTLGAIAVDAFSGNITLPRWCASFRIAAGLLIPGLVLNRTMIELLLNTRHGRQYLPGIDVESPSVMTVQCMGEVLIAVAFFCMINASLKWERADRLPKALVHIFAPIGRISYSLYLVHIPILLTLEKWFPQPPSPQGWIVRLITYWPAVLASAALFYHMVEKWFLNMRKTVPVGMGDATRKSI